MSYNHIDALVPVQIFDDPEYCAVDGQECRFFEAINALGGVTQCRLFNWSSAECSFRKCPECRTIYQKTKGIPSTGCMADLNDGDKPALCVVDDPDFSGRNHKEDCVFIAAGKTKETCGNWKTVYVKPDDTIDIDETELINNLGALR